MAKPTLYGTTTQTASASIASFSHDSGSGSNRVLRVWTSTLTNNSGDGITAVTFNSISLTNVATASSEVAFGGRFGEVMLWYLISPATGSNTLAFTYSSSGDVRSCCITATTFEGAHQTSPIGVTNTTSGSSDSASFTETTTAADSLLEMGFAIQGGDTEPFTPGSGDTEVSDLVSGTNAFLDHGHTVAYQPCTSTGSYTVSSTASVTDNTVAGVAEIKPIAAAAAAQFMTTSKGYW